MSTKKATSKKVAGIKKGKFKLSSIIALVLLLAAVLAGLYLVRQNQNIEEDAAGIGCRSYNNDKDACNANCGGAKKDGSTYKCRFGKNGCVETSQKCTGGGGISPKSLCSQYPLGKCVTTSSECPNYVSLSTSDCIDTTPICCTNIALNDIEYGPKRICVPGSTRSINCKRVGYTCNISVEKQYCGSNGENWYTLGTKCVCDR